MVQACRGSTRKANAGQPGHQTLAPAGARGKGAQAEGTRAPPVASLCSRRAQPGRKSRGPRPAQLSGNHAPFPFTVRPRLRQSGPKAAAGPSLAHS